VIDNLKLDENGDYAEDYENWILKLNSEEYAALKSVVNKLSK
jgi:hypothetical protein